MERIKDISRHTFSKQEARAYMKERRKAVSVQEREKMDEAICRALFFLPCMQKAQWCYTFVSYKTEVDTIRIIQEAWRQKKRVAVPKVMGSEMEFFEITCLEQLKEGYQGILEPDGTIKVPLFDGVFLMPGLAFDKQKHRVGYGGGFYDKYLEKHHRKNITTIALAYDFQIVDAIASEAFDLAPQWILTEKRLF